MISYLVNKYRSTCLADPGSGSGAPEFQATRLFIELSTSNKNATHKKRVVTQTFVVHKWSVIITDHLKRNIFMPGVGRF